jgi:hypothetical protein
MHYLMPIVHFLLVSLPYKINFMNKINFIFDNRHTLFELTEDDRADPGAVIDDFCDEFKIGEVRKKIDDLTNGLIVDEEYNAPEMRHQLLGFKWWLMRLFEATYLSFWRRQNGTTAQIQGETPPGETD